MLSRRARSSCLVLLLLAACGDDGGAILDARQSDAPNLDGDDDPRPAPVTGLAAADTPSGLRLVWTNPGDADLAGILVVARTGGAAAFMPADGTTYAPGTQLAPGERVAATELREDLAFPALAATDYTFAVWAFDASLQYSLVATTAGRTNVLGVQAGIIQLFQDGRVVVTQQPPAFTLSGTNVYDAAADTMSADLAARNDTGRVIFNLKALVDSTTQGTVTNAPFPSEGGDPMAYFGPAGLAPAASANATIDLSGIDGSVDPVELVVHFADAPALVLEGGGVIEAKGGGRGVALVDTAGSGREGSIFVPGQPCAQARARGSALTADARVLYTGSKSAARAVRFDLAGFAATAGPTLVTDTGVGSVPDVVLSADGQRLFAVLQDGTHLHGGAGTGGPCGGSNQRGGRAGRRHARATLSGHAIDAPGVMGPLTAGGIGGGPGVLRLVELDPTTLGERRRATLAGSGSYGKVALLAGNRAVVTVEEGRAHLVDLAAMTEIDTDPATDGVQPIELGSTNVFQAIGVAPDGGSFSIAVDNDLGGYRLLSFASATGALLGMQDDLSVPGFHAVIGLVRNPDGTVLVLARSASKGPTGGRLLRLDGTTVTPVVTWEGGDSAPAGVTVRGGRAYVPTRFDGARVYDLATGTEVDTDGVATNGVTPLPLRRSPRAQGTLVVTPF